MRGSSKLRVVCPGQRRRASDTSTHYSPLVATAASPFGTCLDFRKSPRLSSVARAVSSARPCLNLALSSLTQAFRNSTGRDLGDGPWGNAGSRAQLRIDPCVHGNSLSDWQARERLLWENRSLGRERSGYPRYPPCRKALTQSLRPLEADAVCDIREVVPRERGSHAFCFPSLALGNGA